MRPKFRRPVKQIISMKNRSSFSSALEGQYRLGNLNKQVLTNLLKAISLSELSVSEKAARSRLVNSYSAIVRS